MRELEMHDGKKISLIDDLFTVNEKRLEQIANQSKSLDIELILGNGTRVDALHGTRIIIYSHTMRLCFYDKNDISSGGGKLFTPTTLYVFRIQNFF